MAVWRRLPPDGLALTLRVEREHQEVNELWTRLGLAWEAVRRTAPTRPQPLVSRRPPGNALAALPLTCWNDPATAWMRRPDVTPQDRGLIVLDLGIQHHRLSSQPAF